MICKPRLAYANCGGKLNETKMMQLFPTTNIFCLSEINKLNPTNILPCYDRHTLNKRTAIMYSSQVSNIEALDMYIDN